MPGRLKRIGRRAEVKRDHTVESWLDHLRAGGWKGWREGQEWKGPCPRCGGRNRFHVRSGDTRSVVAHCRHGCDFSQLLRAVFGSPPVPARQRRSARNSPSRHGSKGQPQPTNPQLDPDDLDPAGLAAMVLLELQLTPAWRQYLSGRALDPDRLAKAHWRSVDGVEGWGPIARMPAFFGWPAWENGQPRWPLGVNCGSALFMPYRERSGCLVGMRIRGGGAWKQRRRRKGQHAPKCLGLAGAPVQLYGAEALGGLEKGGVLHIAEGEIDTESLREHGVAAIGVPGASIWKKEWTAWLRECHPHRIVIWFDGDQAGTAAGEKLRDRLREFGVYRLTGVAGKDVNDLARDGELEGLVRKAERE